MSKWVTSGKVNMTNGSKVVIGIGTTWVGKMIPGSIFITEDREVYEAEDIISNTELRLSENYTGPTSSNVAYAAAPTQAYLPELAARVVELLGTFGELKTAWQSGELNGQNFVILGSKPSVADLPATDNRPGSVWMVGENAWTWTGTSWFDVGPLRGKKGDPGELNPLSLQAVVDAQAAATAADTAKTAASASATAAAGSATTAQTAQTAASASATAAQGSATAAAGSVATVQAAATAAGLSKDAAAASATAAADSVTTTQGHVTAAAGSATAAAASAITATGSKDAAALSATASEASKVAAEGFKTTAQTAAVAASEAATDALNFSSDSGAYAAQSSGFATASAGFATNSAASSDASEASKTSAETAAAAAALSQTGAAAARTGAETALTGASAQASAAAGSAGAAATSRSGAEAAEAGAASSATLSATSAGLSDSARAAAVVARLAAEAARDEAQGLVGTQVELGNSAGVAPTTTGTVGSAVTAARSDHSHPLQPVDKGDKGDKGDTGDKGDKGDKGDPGNPGTTTWAGITDKPKLGFPPIKIAVVGDSMAAQQVLADSLSWPERWAQMMKSAGVAVEVINLAVSGHTFYRANTQSINGLGQTVRDQLIALAPSVVIVALGANDSILNVDNRTLAQTQADANTFLNTVKAALPSSVIIAGREYMYDAVNFTTPGTTLLNKGAFPGIFALKSSGILSGLYTKELLDDDIGATQRGRFSNWLALMNTVTTNAGVSGAFNINAWRVFRLGAAGTDGTHMTAMGQTLLASYVFKAAQTNSTMVALWPGISTASFITWCDPDNLFTDTFNGAGNGYVTKADTYPSDWISKHPGLTTLRPDTWWNRSGAVVRVSNSSVPYDASQPSYWSVYRARRNQTCQVSLNGGAWAGAGGSGVTDETGSALFVANNATLPVGVYTLRYRVGDESFGPFTLTVTAGPSTPHLRLAQTTETWNVSNDTFDSIKYNNVLSNEGGGTWSAGNWTVPKDGIYVLTHNIGTVGGGSGVNFILAGIAVNGILQAEGNPDFDNKGGFGSVVSTSIRLFAGNTVSFMAYVAYTNSGVPGRGWAPGARGRTCTASAVWVSP